MSNPLLLSDGLSATKYVGMATDAAREMLAVAYRVHQMDQLCLAPIRWIVRLVHAAVFLVKTVLLTPTGSMYIHKSTVAMIRRTANMLKDSSPDELHLANRYASILLHICHDMAEKCNNFQINEETAPNNNIRAAAAIISAHGNGPLSQQQQDIQLLHRLKDLQNKILLGVASAQSTRHQNQLKTPTVTSSNHKCSSSGLRRNRNHRRFTNRLHRSFRLQGLNPITCLEAIAIAIAIEIAITITIAVGTLHKSCSMVLLARRITSNNNRLAIITLTMCLQVTLQILYEALLMKTMLHLIIHGTKHHRPAKQL